MIDSLRQVRVVSALARLAGNGAWARILDGQHLYDAVDLADARLLVAADVLRERGDGCLEPVDFHPWYDDPEVLATGLAAQLRRALEHCEGGTEHGGDAESHDMAAMGAASRSVATILADTVLPMLSVSSERLANGTAYFLDVGVGTGAITETLCRAFPGILAVGLDVSPVALRIAERRLVDSSMSDRVELRRQSVVDLCDEEAYDLAWLPQIFLSPDELERGLGRVHAALRPGCWLVMPVATATSGCTPLERAALEHEALLRGGGTLSLEQATDLLVATGFVETWHIPGVDQALILTRKA